MKQVGTHREVTTAPHALSPLEEWEAFAARIAEHADEYHEADSWLQWAQKEIDRLRVFEGSIDMPATKALIQEGLRFLEGRGFAAKVLADERKKLELLYTNDKARRIVWINAFYPTPDVATSHIKVSNLDGGSFWFRDWMANKGRPFDDDMREESGMAGMIRHDARLLEVEARGDMNDVLAGRAWRTFRGQRTERSASGMPIECAVALGTLTV